MRVTKGLSFTATVRNELARVEGATPAQRRAELTAITTLLGRLRGGKDQVSLQVSTTSAALARKVFKYSKIEYGSPPTISVRRRGRGANGNIYDLQWSDHEFWGMFFDDFPGDGPSNKVLPRPRIGVLKGEPERGAFVRGLFLAAGHVHPPHRGYHLEILIRDPGLAEESQGIMSDLNIPVRVARRRDGYALYVRGGEQVAHVLTVMGAHRAVLAFEDARVYRDVRGLVNRLTNAETANLNKVAEAAVRQIRDIQIIAEQSGLSGLPESLQAVARARLEYPELSLRELGQQMQPPLTKSAIAHRMRRIQVLARSLRSKVTKSSGEVMEGAR